MKKFLVANSFFVAVELFINLLLKIILARFVSKSELVFYYTSIDCLSFLALFHAGFKDSLVRFINSSINLKKLTRIYLKSFTVLGLFFFLLIPFVFEFFVKGSFAYSWVDNVQLMAVYVMALYSQYISYKIIALREYRRLTIYSFVKTILLVALIGLFFTLDSHLTKVELLFAYGLSALLIALLNRLKWPLSEQSTSDKEIDLMSFYKDTTFASFDYLSNSLFIYLSTVLFLTYFTVDELANFQVVARPIYISLLSLFSYPVFRFLFPELARQIKDKKFIEILRQRRKFLKVGLFLSIAIILGIHLFIEPLVSFVFTDKYLGAVPLIRFLVIALPFSIMSAYFFSVIKGSGLFKESLYIRIIGALSYFVCFYICHYFQLGPISIIYSIVFNVVVVFLLSYMLERKVIKDWAV